MKITRTLAAALLTVTVTGAGLTAPAAANYGTQVCVADPLDPQLIHTPRVIETDADDDDLGGMIVRPFPNSAVGCAAYDGQPLQEWEELYPGERSESQTAQHLASCKANALRLEALVTSVAGERDALRQQLTAAEQRIAEQRAVIRELRRKLRRR